MLVIYSTEIKKLICLQLRLGYESTINGANAKSYKLFLHYFNETRNRIVCLYQMPDFAAAQMQLYDEAVAKRTKYNTRNTRVKKWSRSRNA